MSEKTLGYKVVGNDYKGSNGYLYTIGKEHRQDGSIRLCLNGLHYSEAAIDAEWYGQLLVVTQKIAEPVRYLSVADTESDPSCFRDISKDKTATRTLKVLDELSPENWKMLLDAETGIKLSKARTVS